MHGTLILTKTVFFPILQSSLRVVLIRNEALGCRDEQWRFISLLVGDLVGCSETIGIFSCEGTGSLRGCREHPEAWT